MKTPKNLNPLCPVEEFSSPCCPGALLGAAAPISAVARRWANPSPERRDVGSSSSGRCRSGTRVALLPGEAIWSPNPRGRVLRASRGIAQLLPHPPPPGFLSGLGPFWGARERGALTPLARALLLETPFAFSVPPEETDLRRDRPSAGKGHSEEVSAEPWGSARAQGCSESPGSRRGERGVSFWTRRSTGGC